MQEVIQFLMNDADALTKIKEGTASLLGVSSEELKAILDVFSNDVIMSPNDYYWK
ncbi:competence pheromone ComX [Cytobacillus sp. Hz8]|uniref:competence pheromone ComX n=1 Tax=Cytobacillus sp. Hz8 TaxID=3347168 RepID=UPI0035D81E61